MMPDILAYKYHVRHVDDRNKGGIHWGTKAAWRDPDVLGYGDPDHMYPVGGYYIDGHAKHKHVFGHHHDGRGWSKGKWVYDMSGDRHPLPSP
jgi:hypothetical protein